ncbi:MAG: DNA repair protein RecN [Candidatus Pelagadaptatus aseana]|uniref:DNA repair protein RecN n=1 Tax=Candidatus Pelagadaptatus aseana TaxID=3120508 RepID=UPI0039B1E2C6
MLTHLSVHNFTLVDELELELDAGMTAITGETGAGKSILLDALSLTLGDRADADRVRQGKERADICATFDISRIPQAREWLMKNELGNDSECLLRRVVTRDGRSRGYINGKPSPITQLRELGEMMIDLHSQHAHQSLLKKTTHQRLLDDYSGNSEALTQCRQQFKHWQTLQQQFDHLKNNADEVNARLQLLRYQVQELNSLGLEPGELEQLEQEQQQLSSADSILQSSQQVALLCEDEEAGLAQLLNRAIQCLGDIDNKPPALNTVADHLFNAQVEIQEAQGELRHHIDTFEADPERLQWVEDRLSGVYEIARKHRINPEELLALHQNLAEELASLEGSEGNLDLLETEVTSAKETYLSTAKQLSEVRQQQAQTLQHNINQQLDLLSMKNAQFAVAIATDAEKASATGIDDIEFLISTNPGQPPKSLGKVASGGELSRVSLAIQVVTAQSSTTPTLVFDEVDVGIGGATADVVGQLLRTLGQDGQVICVTHLAQVASKAHQHLLVHKQSTSDSAQSTLTHLPQPDRIKEIARMMSGENLGQQSMTLAEEMINQGQQLAI